MEKELTKNDLIEVKHLIHTIRGVQVMLDSDLAKLYSVSLKRLNEQVKRNIERFPPNFMFHLNENDFKPLRSQKATIKNKRGKHRKYLPYVFTEQGVAMLSSVLKSKPAIEISIKIINSFVEMRMFLNQNSNLFLKIKEIERNHLDFEIKTEHKFKKIFDALQLEKPNKGIFYDGQVFDAHIFISKLIKNANRSIILIDNFIDDTVLTLFSKKQKKVKVVIYTKKISRQLKLDIDKFNTQYGLLEIKEFKKSHDRFLIIDDSEIYHIGASIKDLGKKWFAFSKFNIKDIDLISKLKTNQSPSKNN